MSTKPSFSHAAAKSMLLEFYGRNGYMRLPNGTRREAESQAYKKGYEVRFIAESRNELTLIRRLLKQLELKAGKPFKKSNRWCQPIYGREAVEQFREWLK